MYCMRTSANDEWYTKPKPKYVFYTKDPMVWRREWFGRWRALGARSGSGVGDFEPTIQASAEWNDAPGFIIARGMGLFQHHREDRGKGAPPWTPCSQCADQRQFPPDFGDSQAGNAVPAYLFNEVMLKANAMGTFVEFGCADGTTHSTTYAFEKMGWKGLCIESNYRNFLKARTARKNAVFALVTSKLGTFTYAQMSGNECNQASGIIEVVYSARNC